MAHLCCRHRLPVILLAMVLVGNAQAVVDPDSKSIQKKQRSDSLLDEQPIPDTPKDLMVDVSCNNQAFITWSYSTSTDGFLATICHEAEVPCSSEEIDFLTRHYTVKLLKRDESYNISLSAYRQESPTIYSEPATMQFSSYPEVPEVKSVTLTPLNYSAIRATWKTKWAHEIKFTVCKTPKVCDEHTVQGTELHHTFNGLDPDTAYTISAQAEVTVNNKTCQGTPERRTARTFAKPPGPVSNLKHEIVNSVYLNASWDAPKDTHDVDGYTIECRDIEGEYDVAKDVLKPKSSVDVTIFLQKFASTFNCSVWAFNSNLGERVNGTKTVFEVGTRNLDPPEDLNVAVQCENRANVTWHYDLAVPITGFLATLCEMNGSLCTNKTLEKDVRGVSFRLLDGAPYNISVVAYVDTSLQTVYSRPATEPFFSFPNLPKLDDVSVSALNSSALRASWKEVWSHEIDFNVCTAPHDCKNYTVHGLLKQYTFSGLQPDTEYTVTAQAEVTLNNRTCKGPQQSRTASTFAEAPGKVTELKHHIKNGIILIASWKSPKKVEAVKGYTISCVESETGKNVTADVDKPEPSVEVSLNLHEPIGVFDCAVWAYNVGTSRTSKGHRVPGPKTTFDVTTKGIFPPKDVKLVEHTATTLTFTWIADPTAPGWNITAVPEGQLAHSAIEEYAESRNKSVTHNVTNLVPWTKYNISIANCRPAFCSEPTVVLSTTDVAAPSEVRHLNYTIVEDVKVWLTWKAPEHPNGPIDGYSVAVFNEDQQEGTLYDVRGHLNETKIDLKYEFNVFNISVRAYNVDKGRNETVSGPASDVLFETLGKGPMPPRPEVGPVADLSVHLYWEMPEDPRYNITGFNVSVSHRQSFITQERNFTIMSLEPWMDYNISVSSCINRTECGQEEDRHFKTDVGEPSEPLDFKVGSAGTHWLLVEWKQPKAHNGPLSGYNVTFKKDGAEVQETTTQLSYKLTALAAGTTYDVSVYAFNDGLVTAKRGPRATLKAATESEKTSTTVILLAVFIPLILLLLVAGFFLYKKYQKKTGDRQPLTSSED